MKTCFVDFCKIPFVFAAVLATFTAVADQAPNPRATSSNVMNSSAVTAGATSRGNSDRVVNVNSNKSESGVTTSGRSSATVTRSATTATRPSTTISRAAVNQPSKTTVVTGRSGTVRQMASAPTVTSSARSATTSRAAASNVVRGATHNPASTARAASNNSVVGASRAATARATAVFTDIDAIGGGYAECRQAYATCMDQFCANANDTYRRCVCSARYNEFRNTENAISEALDLLAQFQDNNLTAVGLSAEEVNAMYTATEGENAIKRDTSAAGEMLAEIDDLLSGNVSSSSGNTNNSLGLLTVDFTSDLGDIWGDGGNSIFDSSAGVDLSTLTGEELYSEASKQCMQLIADSCENNAVLTMARSAYSIMITQDCNIYERNINSQKESLEQTVRTAEKYLREARLEEYQSHNSADVNECLENVRSAMLADVACGANYVRCLDPTGAYINATTGDPIYSPRLFQLANTITLPGVTDSGFEDNILSSNSGYDNFLESKKMFAETALDSCRDISDIVWNEFKRQAIIEIAQAQDEKIEEVKMSCVSTMAECYDTQMGALRDFDTTTAQYSGALSAAAARSMCQDQVIACASLYGNTNNCKFDGNGRLEVGNNSSSLTGEAANDRCGLTALLQFVDSVDTTRINEGCETALQNYATELCTPSNSENVYPYGCIGLSRNDLEQTLNAFANRNCAAGGNRLTMDIDGLVDNMISDIDDALLGSLSEQCEEMGGYWIYENDETYGALGSNATPFTEFYTSVFGIRLTNFNEATSAGDGARYGLSYGQCAENTIQVRCLDYNNLYGANVATYNESRNECVLNEEWYAQQCESALDGYYENGTCYALSADTISYSVDTISHSVNGMSRKDFENQ